MKKPYQNMTVAELAEATKEFDQPGTIDRTRPMTAAERAQEHRARHAGGRPIIGRGSQRINITVERELLRRADQLAKRYGSSRSELIARGLSLLLESQAV